MGWIIMNKKDQKKSDRKLFLNHQEEQLLDGKSIIATMFDGFEAVHQALKGIKQAANIDNSMLDKKTKDAIQQISDLANKQLSRKQLKQQLDSDLEQIENEPDEE